LPRTDRRRVLHTLRDRPIRCHATNISLLPELQMAEMTFASSLLFYFVKHPSHHPSTRLHTSPTHWKDKPHKMHEMHEMHVLYHSAQNAEAAHRSMCGKAMPFRRDHQQFPGGYAALQIRFSKTKANFIDHYQPTHLPDSLEGQFSQNDTLFTNRHSFHKTDKTDKCPNRSVLERACTRQEY